MMRAALRRVTRRFPLVAKALWKIRDVGFPGTAVYWERRYRQGGTSGPGSYGRLARFKADVLNELVRREGITSVIELGCGDGHQVSLAEYPSYVGMDVSAAAVERCRQRFRGDSTKQFQVLQRGRALPEGIGAADLALSLDVIYHLAEDEVFDDYMTRLFAAGRRFVVIYSSNHDEPFAAYLRHRRFTDWVERQAPEFRLVEKIDNPYPYESTNPEETSFADFYVFRREASSGAQEARSS